MYLASKNTIIFIYFVFKQYYAFVFYKNTPFFTVANNVYNA